MKNFGNSQVLVLWEQYQRILFQWEGKPLAEDDFAILTAYNPKSRVQDQIINRIKQQKLTQYLTANRYSFAKILCGNPDFSYCEPSISVKVGEYKARNLATIYGQNAFYLIRAGQLWLEPALLKNMEPVDLGKFSDFLK